MNLAPVADIDIERQLATESGKRAVSHADLSTLIPNVQPSSGKPSAYVFAREKTQHVIYRATNGDLHDLFPLDLGLGIRARARVTFKLYNSRVTDSS
jgi:hypothetical protein